MDVFDKSNDKRCIGTTVQIDVALIMTLFWIHWHMLPVRQRITSMGYLCRTCVQEKISWELSCIDEAISFASVPMQIDVSVGHSLLPWTDRFVSNYPDYLILQPYL